jgi:glycerol-3-phosphate dehydrogenase
VKNILIIGSGAMGAAFSIPLIENKHKVTLSEPHNIKLINKLNLKKKISSIFKN